VLPGADAGLGLLNNNDNLFIFAARRQLGPTLRVGPNVVLPLWLFELNRYGAAPLKAPASALLRARWARELFPEPLADAHWENFTPGPCAATAPARSNICNARRRRKWAATITEGRGGEPDPTRVMYMLGLCS
jgi:hypothetical protein